MRRVHKSLRQYDGFPKTRYHFGDPNNKDYGIYRGYIGFRVSQNWETLISIVVFWGSILGSPYLGKLPSEGKHSINIVHVAMLANQHGW